MNDPSIWIKEFFIQAGLSYSLSSMLSTLALVVIVSILSWVANFIAKLLINTIVTRIVRRTTSQWDDIFLQAEGFYTSVTSCSCTGYMVHGRMGAKGYPVWLVAIHKMAYIYMVFAGMIVLLSFIEAWHQIYNTLAVAQHRHIKGYLQLVKFLVILVTILVVISVIFRKDISTIMAGLGAMAAVLILVFKDTLLGLVASIQLSADNMLRVGDWITIQKRDVDGLVIDITLNNVKIQNFDKTIINVPTYSLVNDSFQNWKGMEESGVRQIKRAIFIDMRSIRFLDKELRDKLFMIPSLKDYILSFEANRQVPESAGNENLFFNSSRLTNLGVFRFYAESYIRKHPYIDTNQPFIVRHRPPEGNGLPLQVYGFSMNNQMVPYENIQSEIFEHLLAIINEFGLKVFQQPTGDDMLAISRSK
ncbi:MAG: mechanosensitive ion channel [Bacteroidales bacterium]|nr:mechanosensitive ion channel [Bacteroidales bacterium]